MSDSIFTPYRSRTANGLDVAVDMQAVHISYTGTFHGQRVARNYIVTLQNKFKVPCLVITTAGGSSLKQTPPSYLPSEWDELMTWLEAYAHQDIEAEAMVQAAKALRTKAIKV